MDGRTARKIKGRDTAIEVAVRRALWRRGLRFCKNDASVFGSPDVVFKNKKIAVFCDGDFWHGRHRSVPKKNREFWEKKISANIERDARVNARLRRGGWTVLRFSSRDIEKNLEACVDRIVDCYRGL